MFLKEKTFMDYVWDVEKNNFKQDYVVNNRTQIITDSFVDGNTLYKVPIRRSSIQDLLKNYRYPVSGNKADSKFHVDNVVFNQVTSQILDIKLNADFKTCLEYIGNLRKKAGNNLFGVLLRAANSKKVIINPLHPLTALSVLNDEKFLSGTKFNLLAYFYPDRNALDIELNTYMADKDAIKKNLDALLITYGNRLATEVRVDEITPSEDGESYNITYRTKKHPDEERDYDYYIVTHQLITRGIICPYYGTSLIKSGSQVSGAPISPLKSANISTGAARDSLVFGNVCTGSLSNRTLNGLRSLTHSNLSSAYCSSNFLDGSLAYIDACINKSFEIYNKSGFVNLEGVILDEQKVVNNTHPFSAEELTTTTVQEFRAMHPELAMDQFVKLLKQLREVQNEHKSQNNNES